MVMDAHAWKGPCSSVDDGASWVLTDGDLVSWIRALRICQEKCPFKTECSDLREELYPRSRPEAVIWAGVAYSSTGGILDAAGLRRLAASRRPAQRHSGGRAEAI